MLANFFRLSLKLCRLQKSIKYFFSRHNFFIRIWIEIYFFKAFQYNHIGHSFQYYTLNKHIFEVITVIRIFMKIL